VPPAPEIANESSPLPRFTSTLPANLPARLTVTLSLPLVPLREMRPPTPETVTSLPFTSDDDTLVEERLAG
jgi:hypothetical protein